MKIKDEQEQLEAERASWDEMLVRYRKLLRPKIWDYYDPEELATMAELIETRLRAEIGRFTFRDQTLAAVVVAVDDTAYFNYPIKITATFSAGEEHRSDVSDSYLALIDGEGYDAISGYLLGIAGGYNPSDIKVVIK